jgi:hypothetical protein
LIGMLLILFSLLSGGPTVEWSQVSHSIDSLEQNSISECDQARRLDYSSR